jgi:hypothetical protein
MQPAQRTVVPPDDTHKYFVANQAWTTFVMGEVGSPHDFFLIGAAAEPETCYPLLTGNLLDSAGRLLCRLVRNVLTRNPANCQKVMGAGIGYEIRDALGRPILSVKSRLRQLLGLPQPIYVTSVTGNLYDRTGRLVFATATGEESGRPLDELKYGFGAHDQLRLTHGMTEQDQQAAQLILNNRGVVLEPVSGEINGGELCLDGKILTRVRVKNCKVVIRTGEFVIVPPCELDSNTFVMEGPAWNVVQLYLANANSTLRALAGNG